MQKEKHENNSLSGRVYQLSTDNRLRLRIMSFRSILLICVNYNSYNELYKYIISVAEAISNSGLKFKFDILIPDNSDVKKRITCPDYSDITIKQIFNETNEGYLGGVISALEKTKLSPKDYEFFIISNVDLILSKSFFKDLFNLRIDSKTGWISPSIISEKENRDRNPKIITRPSKRKMKVIALMYLIPIFHFLYSRFVYPRKSRASSKHSNRKIYAGHGSFMIFTNSFTKKNVDLDYQSFLFGEEIFFAELIRASGLETIHLPELLVYDTDHVSTSKLKRSVYYKMNYQSIKYIIKRFF